MMNQGLMGRSNTCQSMVLSLALLASLASCTSKTEAPKQRRPEAPSQRPAAEAKSDEPVEFRFDAQGKLLPSDNYVAGVRLPRGAELFRQEELLHIYRIRAPVDKVLAYFGPMMVTGNVERRGKGAVYKRASVRGAEISPTKVDVAILEVGNSMTRISVTELPPPPAHAPTANETKAAARQHWRTLD